MYLFTILSKQTGQLGSSVIPGTGKLASWKI